MFTAVALCEVLSLPIHAAETDLNVARPYLRRELHGEIRLDIDFDEKGQPIEIEINEESQDIVIDEDSTGIEVQGQQNQQSEFDAPCERNEDCRIGHCQLGSCWVGTESHPCQHTIQCQRPLVCRRGGRLPGLQCLQKKKKGDFCQFDGVCFGYCRDFKCWDGSEDDLCLHTSECQEGLICRRDFPIGPGGRCISQEEDSEEDP